MIINCDYSRDAICTNVLCVLANQRQIDLLMLF